MTVPLDPRLSPDRQRPKQPRRTYSRQLTRMANGTVVINGVDQRDRFPKRIREKQADYARTYPDASVGERAIITNVCVLEFQLEEMTTEFALLCKADKSVPAGRLDLYGRLMGHHRRQLETLDQLYRQRRERAADPDDDPLQYAARYRDAEAASVMRITDEAAA
jgi:hypothetical protein